VSLLTIGARFRGVTQPPLDPAEISVSLGPTSRSAQQGQVATYAVTLGRVNYGSTVSFSVTGLPAGVTGAFSPETLSGAETNTTLTLTVAGDAASVSSDAFTVTATGTGVTDATAAGAITVTAAPSLGDWQLPAGNFETAKMSMVAVYPRPNAETSATARHRKAMPNMANRIPVVVQGGAYPFYYEIVTAPAGASIGQQIGSTDYGVFSWTPTADGSAEAITVRVTDQELNTVDVTWTMQADTASFVFLDAAATSSGSGTLASPFKTWTDAFGTDSTVANNSGKVLVLRGGSHTMVGFSGSTNNLRMDGTNKPLAWIAYPDETPTVDCSTAVVNMSAGSDGNDMFVQGITFANSRADVANSRFFFYAGQAGARVTFHDTFFRGLVRGTSGGTDNPGAIVMFNQTAFRDYFAVVGGGISDHAAPMVGSIYRTRYAVIEGVTLGAITGSTTNQGLYAKGANVKWSFRRCTSTVSDYTEGALQHAFGAGEATASEPQLMEVCYCLLRVPTATRVAFGIHWSSSNSSASSVLYAYRNTIVGRSRILDAATSQFTVQMTRNVLVTNDSPLVFSDDQGKVTYSENLSATVPNIATIIDTNTYLLTGASRTAYLGRYGHEISAGA